MTLTKAEVKEIIKKLLSGEDYRIVVISLINKEFLRYCIDFFKKIVDAKLDNENLPLDWYKKELLNPSLPPEDIAINSGLNKKTIHNMHGSSTKEIVIEASNKHYEALSSTIDDLINSDTDIDLELKIKLRGVEVDLNINESLIVINALAVKRAAIRGGLWSAAGKRSEKPLMLTLCKLYDVNNNNYAMKIKNKEISEIDFQREIDFYLINNGVNHKCEVKLMGRGNPESADVVVARESKVFVACKLSDKNKKQLDSLNVEWVELRSENGFQKFGIVLDNLGILHRQLPEEVDTRISDILDEILGA
jgi:hypothetical protein